MLIRLTARLPDTTEICSLTSSKRLGEATALRALQIRLEGDAYELELVLEAPEDWNPQAVVARLRDVDGTDIAVNRTSGGALQDAAARWLNAARRLFAQESTLEAELSDLLDRYKPIGISEEQRTSALTAIEEEFSRSRSIAP